MIELMRLYKSLVQLMRERHRSNKIRLVHELGVKVCTTVGITSEEVASESFSGIGIPKNGLLFMCDGASWSAVVEKGEPVDTTGSGATTSAIRAITSRAGQSTLGGGVSNSQTSVEIKDPNQFLKVVQTVLKEEGLARVRIYQKSNKTVKNGQARARESEENKKKPKNQSRSQTRKGQASS
ncbi:hypothetical protein Tco_1325138 [Tanacetum coccineum]